MELAQRMVRLSGRSIRDEHNPEGDIAIEITGLRAGEKLQEELLIDGSATGTLHARIVEVRETTADIAQLEAELMRLEARKSEEESRAAMREMLTKWVAGYGHPAPQAASGSLRAISGGLIGH
jgi:FlaA1/EpsC-like NDP-sugar epimerase